MTIRPRVAVLALVAVAAAPVPPPADLVRDGNGAFRHGDFDAADAHYKAAADRADDPGLVTFNRAAVRFAQGDFREAERLYARALADPECPPPRRARAWFDRGTALVRRGGSADVFRSAVACFEQALAVGPIDDALTADARHNLELAKLLWATAREKENGRPKASRSAPEDEPKAPPKPDRRDPPPTPEDGSPDPNGKGGPPRPQPQPRATPDPKRGEPKAGDETVPGAGALPPLDNGDDPQPLGADDTREHLRRIADRLRRDRASLTNSLAGPDRPGVKDW